MKGNIFNIVESLKDKVYKRLDEMSVSELLKRLASLNLKLLRTDEEIFQKNLMRFGADRRQAHLFNAKKALKKELLESYSFVA